MMILVMQTHLLVGSEGITNEVTTYVTIYENVGKNGNCRGHWAGCSAQSLEQKLCKNENIDN